LDKYSEDTAECAEEKGGGSLTEITKSCRKGIGLPQVEEELSKSLGKGKEYGGA